MTDDIAEKPASQERIIPREIEDEMKQSYLAYSMSVIVGRALPDVRDGLKPVHRRILYAMHDMGMTFDKPFKKCATVVGETLGKYHPHGDTAVYDSLVRMAQDFSLRYPLIRGQGNFGSVDGDNAAAMRYTESKLHKLGQEMLIDIEKNTVKFIPNYDESQQEPSVLPGKFPNLLVNGSSGIAVGMATNMPPHNLTESCNAITAVIDNPDIELPELMQHISGPDFPTAGIIQGTSGILKAYSTGRGHLRVKARTSIEDMKGDRKKIIVKEIPYQVNKSMLMEEIAGLVRHKKIKEISDLRDESDRDGMRIVIELKTNANPEVVINQLYKHSRMQTTFSIINLALVDNVPQVLTLREMLDNFINHRKDVVTKRTEFELDKAEKRVHILEGLVIALEDIDRAVDLIKKAKNAEEARNVLISTYTLSEEQARAILDMRLQRLTGLEQDKIKEEHKGLLELIKRLKEILGDEREVLKIIKEELLEIKEKYGDERKTLIAEGDDEDIDLEDLIAPQEMVVTISNAGYVKRLPVDTYRAQHRGGRGIIGATAREEDVLAKVFVANTHDYLLCFTDKGQVHWLKVYKLPEASRTAKGSAIVNLLSLKEERVTAIVPVKEFKEGYYLCLATKKGVVKKTSLADYSRPRNGGVRGITLDEGDELIAAQLTDGSKNVILATRNGNAIKFKESDARPIGRTARGVRGISLKSDDQVIGMILEEPNTTILTVTENGFGKRTKLEEYRVINRGGLGVINIQTTERNGKVVFVAGVSDTDDVMVISRKGIIIRIPTKDISVIGRNTQGVRIMKVSGEDKVSSATKIPEGE